MQTKQIAIFKLFLIGNFCRSKCPHKSVNTLLALTHRFRRIGQDCQCDTPKVLTVMTVPSNPEEYDSALFGRSGPTDLANQKYVKLKLHVAGSLKDIEAEVTNT